MQKQRKINTPKRLNEAMEEFWDNSTRKQKEEIIPIFAGFFYGLTLTVLASVPDGESDPVMENLQDALVQFMPALAEMPL